MESTPAAADAGHVHAVRFYQDDDSLCRIVAGFLHDGFKFDQPAIVIATPAHRDAIRRLVSVAVPDIEEREKNGDLLWLDAAETLAMCMVSGQPDPDRFRTVIGDVIARARRGRIGCTVRAFGEMVDLMWSHGDRRGAIRLEMLWNQLATRFAFSLLCGYSMGHFYKAAGFADVCDQHTHVVSESGAIRSIGA